MAIGIFDEGSEDGSSTIERLESEWKLIKEGMGDMGLYLLILDKFLMAYFASTELSLGSIDALNDRYLQILYPNGKDAPKREPSHCSKEDIQHLGLDPEAIRRVLGDKSVTLSSAVVEDFSRVIKADSTRH